MSRILLALAFLPAILLPPGYATANTQEGERPQQSSGSSPRSRTAKARELGLKGLRAFGREKFALSLKLFSQAEALAHSPVFQVYMARCLLELERPEEARTLLIKVIRETPQRTAPEPWLRASKTAQKLLEGLDVAGADAAKHEEKTKGPKAEKEALSPANSPGGHEKQPKDDNREAESQGNSQPGEPNAESRRSTGPQLSPRKEKPTKTREHQASRPAPNEKAKQQRDSGRSGRPGRSGLSRRQQGAVAAYTCGTLGLLFATVMGAVAYAQSQELKSNCVDGNCLPSDLPRWQSAMRYANLATVGLTVGIAGGVTGSLLLPKRSTQAKWWLHVSPRTVQVRGMF